MAHPTHLETSFSQSARLTSFSFLANEQVNFLFHACWSQASALPRKQQCTWGKESPRLLGVQPSSLSCLPYPGQVSRGAMGLHPVLIPALLTPRALASLCSRRTCPASGSYLSVLRSQLSCSSLPISGSGTKPVQSLTCFLPCGSPTEVLLYFCGNIL